MKLHLGGGRVCLPDFVHIDQADFPHIDIKADIRFLPQFEDDSVELIYCSHALGYFDREEVKEALKEWYRVLEPGGVLRLAVPDFEKIIQVYLRHRDIESRGILGPLYGKMEIKTDKGERVIYQKTAYDFTSLAKLLEAVGFTKVHRYDWRETIHRDYDDCSQAYIPHMDKEHGLLISLNVEAEK